MTERDQITRNEMKEAISRSGYVMEQRIFPVLEEKGYYVEPNPAYPDPTTGKSREYDFSATTADKLFKEEHDFLFTQIIGECINNSQPVVFFKSESPIQFLFHQEIKYAGMPLYYIDEKDGSERSLNDCFRLSEFHHYCEGPFSTQYCSFRKKGGKDAEWMAWHEEEHHSIFNSLVEATKFGVSEWFSRWVPPAEGEEEPVNLNLFYPLLVLRGDLYESSQKGRRVSLHSREHIQFRKSVIADNQPDTYQVDVVVERFLPKYLAILEKEAQILARRFRRKKRQVRASIDHIVAKTSADAVAVETKSFRKVLEL
jgi:hypothetical protein